MSQYPGHDKLQAVAEDSQKIGDFLEWLLLEQQVELHCRGAEWIERARIEEILAEYFGVDRAKLENEKCAMIEALRHPTQEGFSAERA